MTKRAHTPNYIRPDGVLLWYRTIKDTNWHLYKQQNLQLMERETNDNDCDISQSNSAKFNKEQPESQLMNNETVS